MKILCDLNDAKSGMGIRHLAIAVMSAVCSLISLTEYHNLSALGSVVLGHAVRISFIIWNLRTSGQERVCLVAAFLLSN